MPRKIQNFYSMTLAGEIQMITKQFKLTQQSEARWHMPSDEDCRLRNVIHPHPAGEINLYSLDVLQPSSPDLEGTRLGNRYKFNANGLLLNVLGVALDPVTEQLAIGLDPKPDPFGNPASMLANYLFEGVMDYKLITIK